MVRFAPLLRNSATLGKASPACWAPVRYVGAFSMHRSVEKTFGFLDRGPALLGPWRAQQSWTYRPFGLWPKGLTCVVRGTPWRGSPHIAKRLRLFAIRSTGPKALNGLWACATSDGQIPSGDLPILLRPKTLRVFGLEEHRWMALKGHPPVRRLTRSDSPEENHSSFVYIALKMALQGPF